MYRCVKLSGTPNFRKEFYPYLAKVLPVTFEAVNGLLHPLTLYKAYQTKYQAEQTNLCKEEIDPRVSVIRQ